MRHEWGTLLAAAALAGGLTLAATGPAGASTARPATGTGEAGYVATGANGTFTSVSSEWTQPTAHCTSGDQYASFWVGLDGYTSDTAEQTGTDSDCVGKTPEYYGWYDLYPASPVIFSNAVKPGDQMATSVSYAGSNKFTIKLADSTQGWSHTVTQTLAGAARSSAEIFVTASPSGVLPISEFGKVTYTDSMVNKAALCKSNPVAVSSPGLTVSPITGCTTFTVTQT
jgi:Peptidase A4 family